MADILDIPRRLSVHDQDYDYNLGRSLRVMFDGIEQDQVISYDIDAGKLERYVMDAKGNIAFDESRNAAVTELVFGAVTVERIG